MGVAASAPSTRPSSATRPTASSAQKAATSRTRSRSSAQFSRTSQKLILTIKVKLTTFDQMRIKLVVIFICDDVGRYFVQVLHVHWPVRVRLHLSVRSR